MKILVIRFSSMGDIIYTTPVVRCLKKQLPHTEIHFLTKPAFKSIFEGNPYVDKLILLTPKLIDTITLIKAEKYDYIIDLHNNLRTFLIKLYTGVKSSSFKKQPILKWLSLKLNLQLIPSTHLVDRYMKAVRILGVENDEEPIDYFFKKKHDLNTLLPATHRQKYVAFIIGATHFTKRMPADKIIEICKKINLPVVLLGGNEVLQNGEKIAANTPNTYNACGGPTIDESVFLVSKAFKVIGFDTGFTHIAEAFNNPIVSIWGGTSPELLGVQPYKVKKVLILGIELPCRPCSKYGLDSCPKKHFNCMNNIPNDEIVNFVNENLE